VVENADTGDLDGLRTIAETETDLRALRGIAGIGNGIVSRGAGGTRGDTERDLVLLPVLPGARVECDGFFEGVTAFLQSELRGTFAGFGGAGQSPQIKADVESIPGFERDGNGSGYLDIVNAGRLFFGARLNGLGEAGAFGGDDGEFDGIGDITASGKERSDGIREDVAASRRRRDGQCRGSGGK
jgi:hypothetical protein